ncbi:MAG: hypothetical protein ACREM2_00625 [Vulcanimicrobiaceae bacterium]
MIRTVSAGALASLVLLCAGVPARAAGNPSPFDATQVFFNQQISGFTNDGGLYGPWYVQTLGARTHVGHDLPGIDLVFRQDHDPIGPSSGQELVLDDYRDWTPSFFSYGQVTTGGGPVFPTRSAYLEGDEKLGSRKQYALGAGAGIIDNADGVIQRYLSLGPSYYWPTGNALFRWVPSWTQGVEGDGAITFSALHGRNGQATQSIELITGAQPPFLNSATIVLPGARTVQVTLDLHQWVAPLFGVELGAEYQHLYNRTGGATIYVRRAFTLGLFYGSFTNVPIGSATGGR